MVVQNTIESRQISHFQYWILWSMWFYRAGQSNFSSRRHTHIDIRLLFFLCNRYHCYLTSLLKLYHTVIWISEPQWHQLWWIHSIMQNLYYKLWFNDIETCKSAHSIKNNENFLHWAFWSKFLRLNALKFTSH